MTFAEVEAWVRANLPPAPAQVLEVGAGDGELVTGIDGPVNILVPPEDPQLAELERLGVARVTFGSGLARVALDEAARLAAAALAAAR